MNNKEAIRRKKLYYVGLEIAITQPIPEASARELDELIKGLESKEDWQLTMRLWKEVSAPLDVAITFIYNNRVLPQYKEELINDETEMTFMPPNEIYDTLKTLILPTVGEFLSVLPISSGNKEALYACVENDNKDGFVALLGKNHCDTTPLARLCSHCMDDVMAGLTMTDEERAFSLDHLLGTKCDDDDNERCRETIAELQSHLETNRSEDNPDSDEQFFSNFFDYLLCQLTADLHYYWNYYDLFTLKERNLIESILDNPIAVNLVDQIWEEYKASFERAPFSLPNDFFEWQHKSNTPKEYFFMDDTLKGKGVETLVAFIDWLADKGYIPDDNDTKALLAFRLTGRCRPKGKKLPAIRWYGKNNKPYELIFIVKSFSDRGDYKKMRSFFVGPEWTKNSDGSYAKSASKNFQRQMAEFYPEACKILI